MNTELKQQLSNLLDEVPNDIDLNNLLQALYREQDLRNLYSRYLLIGAVMRGEQIHPASLDISERIRNNVFNTKSANLPSDFSLIRWFIHHNKTWTIAATFSIFILMIGINSFFLYQKSMPSPTFLSYNRHFWPGIITLDKNQNLSKQVATITPLYPNHYLEIIAPQPNTMQNYQLNNNSTFPIRYNY